MMIRTALGRTVAVCLSIGLSQGLAPVAQAATTHLVDQGSVADRLLDNAKTRQEKIDLFQKALSTPEAKSQAKLMKLDSERLRAAVPHLSDQELQDITQRAHNARDITAGYYHDDDGLAAVGIILLVAAAAILIVVADHHY
jgi:hypothetical protein